MRGNTCERKWEGGREAGRTFGPQTLQIEGERTFGGRVLDFREV